MFDIGALEYIYEKDKRGEELTKDDIKFLYNFYDYYYSRLLGNSANTTYDKYVEMRRDEDAPKIKKELSILLECNEDQITVSGEGALSGDIVCNYGSMLIMKLDDTKKIKFPEIVIGDVIIWGLKNPSNVTMPKYVSGVFGVNGLVSAKGLDVPEHVGADLVLPYLKYARDLKVPNYLGGYLAIPSSAEGFVPSEGFDLSRLCTPSDLPQFDSEKLKDYLDQIRVN